MDRSGFAELLRGFRAERGLTQAALARAAGLSVDTVAAYEQARRAPADESAVEQLAAALDLDRLDISELRVAAGFPALAQGLLARMQRVRAPVSVWDEVDGPWPTLIMNERHEIVAWNAMANAVAELDIGALPPLHRNLLRMASTKHYEDYLLNWDEIIGNLIRFLKNEGVQVDDAAGMPAHMSAIMMDIAASPQDAYLLGRLFSLWTNVEGWLDGDRNVHRIHWRLSDGTELLFIGSFREWSTFDGLFAFDWHPANAATSDWALRVHATLTRVVGDSLGQEASLGAALAHARHDLQMSRAALSARSGVPAGTIEAYESGRRRTPGRDQLLRLAHGLSLDTYRTNAILRMAGHEEEPSDFALWMSGDTPRSFLARHRTVAGTSVEAINDQADSFAWPCFVLDGRCHVVHANPAAEALTHLSQIAILPGRPAPHLMQLAVDRDIRARLLNWPVVAATVLPGRLRPLVLGDAGGTKSQTELLDVAQHLRAADRGAFAALFEVWSDSTTPANPRRIAVRLDWLTEDGEQLVFDCLLTPWDAYDPYWAMDWHPASPETFWWLHQRDLLPDTLLSRMSRRAIT